MHPENPFYQPPKGETSGLPHDPSKGFVIPRPIGWIRATSEDGQDDLAPYSQITNVDFGPPAILSDAPGSACVNDVMLIVDRLTGHQSMYKHKSQDSVNNAKETGEFVWNIAM